MDVARMDGRIFILVAGSYMTAGAVLVDSVDTRGRRVFKARPQTPHRVTRQRAKKPAVILNAAFGGFAIMAE